MTSRANPSCKSCASPSSSLRATAAATAAAARPLWRLCIHCWWQHAKPIHHPSSPGGSRSCCTPIRKWRHSTFNFGRAVLVNDMNDARVSESRRVLPGAAAGFASELASSIHANERNSHARSSNSLTFRRCLAMLSSDYSVYIGYTWIYTAFHVHIFNHETCTVLFEFELKTQTDTPPPNLNTISGPEVNSRPRGTAGPRRRARGATGAPGAPPRHWTTPISRGATALSAEGRIIPLHSSQ